MMTRFLAGVGVLLGVASLAVSLGLRRSESGVLQSLASGDPPVVSAADAGSAWMDIAARLRTDLCLNSSQSAQLVETLQSCDDAVLAAAKFPDALWRDRLRNRARRAAYMKLTVMLNVAQKEGLKVLLKMPYYKDATNWLNYADGCVGCGGS